MEEQKQALSLWKFDEEIKRKYYDAIAYRKNLVVDGYTFLLKSRILLMLEEDGWSIEKEIEYLFGKDDEITDYTVDFYKLYLQWFDEDNGTNYLENFYDKETEKTGKDDL